MTTVRFFLIGVLFSLLAAPLTQAAGADERVLLSAGGIVVTGQDLQQELLLLTGPERMEALATPDRLKNLLRQIYLGKRLVAEAERLGLDRTPLTQARLMAVQRRTLSEAVREQAEQRIEPPDITALAREHYATRRDEFQLPDRFRVAHILKKVSCECEQDPQRQRIEQLQARIKAGEDFAVLAKAESEDTSSAAQGGELEGWLRREQLVAPFADALLALQPGQVSGVVKTQYGFHLIKLLGREPARPQSFEEVQADLEERLRQTYNQEQLRKQAASYMPGADAKFDEPALEAVLQGR